MEPTAVEGQEQEILDGLEQVEKEQRGKQKRLARGPDPRTRTSLAT